MGLVIRSLSMSLFEVRRERTLRLLAAYVTFAVRKACMCRVARNACTCYSALTNELTSNPTVDDLSAYRSASLNEFSLTISKKGTHVSEAWLECVYQFALDASSSATTKRRRFRVTAMGRMEPRNEGYRV